MPRVERFTSEGHIPVQQAQLVDPRSFPTDTSSAEALKVGANLANVFAELAIRKRDAQDSLAATKASRSRTLAELEMQQFMVDNPDPDTWEEGLAKISAKHSANYASLKMSKKTRAKQDIEQQAHNDEMAMRVRLAATNQDIKNDITEGKINLDGLIANDDGSKGDADKIDKAMKSLEAAFLRETTPEIAAEQMEETLRAAKKGYWINQSRRTDEDFDIDKFIAQMQKKKVKIKGGEDKDGLNAKDMDDIIASAYSAKALAEKSLNTQQEIDRNELGQSLQDGTITYDKINATSLDEKEQETYRLKMNAEAKRKAEAIPIQVNQPVKSNLEGMAYDITSGAVTMEDFKTARDEARYPEKGKPAIDDDVYDELTSLAERKFESYQAGAMKGRESFALTQLVTYPGELGFAERLKQLTSQFDKDQAQVLRQLQFDNLDQYKRALRRLFEKPEHKDANADEIYNEGRKMLKHYRKSPDQLREEVETINLPPATDKKILEAAKQVESDIQKGLSGVNTMINPGTLAVFEERMAQLPTRDARQRYYNKWYKDVKDK